MHTKKHLRLYFYLKSMGKLRFVPLIVFDVLLLVLPAAYYYNNGASDDLQLHLLQLTQFFMPLFSVWWAVFALREHLESDGNELLYAGGNHTILKELVQLFLLAMGNIAVLFVFYSVLLPEFAVESLRIVSACIFYFGLSYGLAFFVKSVTIVLLVLLLYTLLNFTVSLPELVFPFFMSRQLLSIEECLTACLPLFLAGLLLSAIGFQANKRFTRYH